MIIFAKIIKSIIYKDFILLNVHPAPYYFILNGIISGKELNLDCSLNIPQNLFCRELDYPF